jgi:AcrR family transcriptional regulator
VPHAPPKRIHHGTRPGGRSARVRDAVLGAALAELLAVGYGALSLPRIAERAGVALSTVHRRWRDKAGLLTDAIGDAAAVRVPDPHSEGLRSDLIALARSVAAMLREPAVVAVLRSAFALPDAELDELRHRFWAERFAVAQAIVDRAIARGELARGTAGWALVEPIHARIWMRLLITGLPLDDALLVQLVDRVVASAQRGEL